MCTAGSGLSYNPFSTRSDPVLMQRSRTAYAQMEHEAAEAAAAQAPMLAPVYDDDEYEHYSRRPGAGGDEAGLSDPVGCALVDAFLLVLRQPHTKPNDVLTGDLA
jgi:hypothetical protein